MFGEIYSLDLTKHTEPSKFTIKDIHMVLVITRDMGPKFPIVLKIMMI